MKKAVSGEADGSEDSNDFKYAISCRGPEPGRVHWSGQVPERRLQPVHILQRRRGPYGSRGLPHICHRRSCKHCSKASAGNRAWVDSREPVDSRAWAGSRVEPGSMSAGSTLLTSSFCSIYFLQRKNPST